jgi:hypothetical protein
METVLRLGRGQTAVTGLCARGENGRELLVLLKCENLTWRTESTRRLQQLAESLNNYVLQNGGRYPDDLVELDAIGDDSEWFCENVKYLGKDKTTEATDDTIIAYDKELLTRSSGTHVLYAGGDVQFLERKDLERILKAAESPEAGSPTTAVSPETVHHARTGTLDAKLGGATVPDANFDDYISSFAPSDWVNMVYDVSILLGRPLRVPIDISSLPTGPSGHVEMPGGFGVFAPSSLPEQRLKTMEEKKAELLQEIQATIDPNSWFENGGEGTMSFYEDKKLVVRQRPDVHRKIEEFLVLTQKRAGRQVAIEVRFIKTSEQFLDDIAIDLTPYWPADANCERIGKVLDGYDADLLSRAVMAHSGTKTLVAPKATVLEGQRAEFSNGRLIPYSYQERNPETGEIEEKTEHALEGTRFRITPWITEDANAVVCEFTVEIADLLGWQEVLVDEIGDDGKLTTQATTLPETETMGISTRVTIPAGRTWLVALPKVIKKEVETGTPILKDPLVGGMFRGTKEVREMLLILLKPTIILPEEAELGAV